MLAQAKWGYKILFISDYAWEHGRGDAGMIES